MNPIINQLLDQQSLNDEQPIETGSEEHIEETPQEFLRPCGIGVLIQMTRKLRKVLLGIHLL
jgi:hypothetical protein